MANKNGDFGLIWNKFQLLQQLLQLVLFHCTGNLSWDDQVLLWQLSSQHPDKVKRVFIPHHSEQLHITILPCRDISGKDWEEYTSDILKEFGVKMAYEAS